MVEGTDFRDAQPSTDMNGRPDMTFTLTTEAGDRFYKYTSAHSKDSRNARLDGHRAGRQGQGGRHHQLGHPRPWRD